MPIIRKVVTVGDSRGITIPKSWLDFYERETGEKIREVTIEVNKVLTVGPIFTKKDGQETSK